MGLKVEIVDSNQQITPLKGEYVLSGTLARRTPNTVNLSVVDGETHIFAIPSLGVEGKDLSLFTPPFELRITPDH